MTSKLENLPLSVTAVQAEGARIGLASCPLCGCALFIDPDSRVDIYAKHLAWHDENDPFEESSAVLNDIDA